MTSCPGNFLLTAVPPTFHHIAGIGWPWAAVAGVSLLGTLIAGEFTVCIINEIMILIYKNIKFHDSSFLDDMVSI